MSLARDTADYGWMKSPRKNLIMNGDFTISQRGTSFPAAAAGDHTMDRWLVQRAGAVVFTAAQQAQTGDYPFKMCHRIYVTTADASIAAGDYCQVTQKVEAHNMQHLNWGTALAQDVTLSFWHRHTVTGTYSVAIRNTAGDRCYVAEYTQATTNTWEESEITIPGCPDGTWGTGAAHGLSLTFTAACGSTYSGTPGSWLTSGNIFSSTNQVNGVATATNVFDIAHVQLEAGSEKTDWDFREYGAELVSCMRYFQTMYMRSYCPIAVGRVTGAGALQASIPLPVPMYSTPTVTTDSVVGWRMDTSTHSGSSIGTDTAWFIGWSPTMIEFQYTAGSLTTLYAIFFGSNVNVYIEAEI